MTQKQNSQFTAYFSIFILAATAATGWYYYYSATGDIKSNLKNNQAELAKLNNKLQSYQTTINRLQADNSTTQNKLLSSKESQKVEITRLQSTIDGLQANKNTMQSKLLSSKESQKVEITSLQSTIDRLQADSNAMQNKLLSSEESQKDEIIRLQSTIDRLQADSNAMQNKLLSSEKSQNEKVSKLQTRVISQQASINSLGGNIDTLSDENANLLLLLGDEKDARQSLKKQLELAISEKKLTEARLLQKVSSAILTTAELETELEKRLAEQNSMQEKMHSISGEKSKLLTQLQEEQENKRIIANLKNRLEQDLNESRVEISQLKNRMTVIKLTSEVLFSSGSARISPEGKKVLSIIAESLNAYSERAISVEGHTDNLPILNTNFQSNWALSVARSMAAVNYFQLNNQVDPKRLQVVGYGEFRPVASNKTVAGRKLNRRIEIKLLPQEIMQ